MSTLRVKRQRRAYEQAILLPLVVWLGGGEPQGSLFGWLERLGGGACDVGMGGAPQGSRGAAGGAEDDQGSGAVTP